MQGLWNFDKVKKPSKAKNKYENIILIRLSCRKRSQSRERMNELFRSDHFRSNLPLGFRPCASTIEECTASRTGANRNEKQTQETRALGAQGSNFRFINSAIETSFGVVLSVGRVGVGLGRTHAPIRRRALSHLCWRHCVFYYANRI